MNERSVQRLEAFSDIVIGFCLAQLGSSLALSRNAVLDVGGVLSFLFAFAIICSLWFFHHRLFETLFVPRTWPIILNFVWLAVVVLLVFVAQQIPKHWGERGLEQLYFGLYTLAYGILGAQAALAFPRSGEPERRQKAIRQTAFMTYWAAVFAVCLVCVTVFDELAVQGVAIDAAFICGGFGSAVLRRYLHRKLSAA